MTESEIKKIEIEIAKTEMGYSATAQNGEAVISGDGRDVYNALHSLICEMELMYWIKEEL
jgi:hypothetical protein